jgi:hypothetical protein
VLREFWPEIARKFSLPFRAGTGITNALPVGAKSQSGGIAEDANEQVRK